ncbi:iron ABC transporter permease [uncultured Desulfobacter sp.]|uniref:FecCD family ABC transporter permease n=1 Tax=uncultured Desulfobacter sp. TaxID=240139 RepID=UPI002AAAE83D|nr:iron ABC transporter permease [uncultured Desulfobacter sp.]
MEACVPRPPRNKKSILYSIYLSPATLYTVLTALLILSATLAIALGPVFIRPESVWQIVVSKILGLDHGQFSRPQEMIVWNIRVPRVLCASFAGMGLSLVGAVIQAIVRNPLASPYTLGVSSGASVGAVAIIALGTVFGLPGHFISLGAFAGALSTFFLVFMMASYKGRFQTDRLILSGIAISYFFSALCSLLTLGAEDRAAHQILFWLLGGLSGTNWHDVCLLFGVITVGGIVLLAQHRSLNLLLMGEETATTLGLNVNDFRKLMFFITSLITGAIVSICGVIGFVGLVMPHVSRLLTGADHKKVLPLSLFLGAIFLIWVDVAARLVLAPSEIPIGVITSICGVPFFLWLIRHKKNF